MLTWLHFGSQNHVKTCQISISRCITFLIDFLFIFDRFGKPTWRHVGHIFPQNGGALWDASLFFVGSMFFFGFLAVLTPFSRKMSRAVLGFGRFWARFLKVSGFILEVSGDNLGLRLLLENLRLLLENLYLQLRLLLENLLFRSILLASGSGWAGGVTRSAKNFNSNMVQNQEPYGLEFLEASSLLGQKWDASCALRAHVLGGSGIPGWNPRAISTIVQKRLRLGGAEGNGCTGDHL